MEQRLKNYLKFYGETADGSRKIEGDKGEFLSRCSTDRIFQHERLIHLIVTVLFAILAVISILASLLSGMGGAFALLDVFCIIDPLYPALLYFGKWRAETV